jgi:hypothetical protein
LVGAKKKKSMIRLNKPHQLNPAPSQFPNCQLGRLDQTHEPLGVFESVWQFRKRVKRIVKRRLLFMKGVIGMLIHDQSLPPSNAVAMQVGALKTGDLVRVRSKEEIRASLGNWNDLKGCAFMEEMWPYCGTTQRVLKPVKRFLDERDYRVKRIRDTVLLDGVNCQGTVDFGPCDRNCFFFWRKEWLEKIE